jgi:hypothetical protein
MNLIPFEQTQLMAEAIAKSKLFGIQTAEQALALGLLCQAEGRHPAEAARDYHIIGGKPSLKSDAMLARFQQAGGKVEWHEYTHEAVSGTFTHPQGATLRVTWTTKDAERAGLGSNPTWKKFPRQMLRARCISEAVRSIYPAVLSGCYAPEEVAEFAPLQVQTEPEPIAIEAIAQPIPQAIERINPMQRLLADKSDAAREKVTAGALKRGWIKEGETYLDIPADVATQAVAFPERFFAAFSI